MALPLHLGSLRVQILSSARVRGADRASLVARVPDGDLLALLVNQENAAGMTVETPVSRADARAWGRSDDDMFAAALANMRGTVPEHVDVMRVTDDCHLFMFYDIGEPVSWRILDLPGLWGAVEPLLSHAARSLLRQPDGLGAIVGVPTINSLIAFIVESGDLATGAHNVVANTVANYEGQGENAVSPWVYWVRAGAVEEMGYELGADGEVDSINFPDALLPRLI